MISVSVAVQFSRFIECSLWQDSMHSTTDRLHLTVQVTAPQDAFVLHVSGSTVAAIRMSDNMYNITSLSESVNITTSALFFDICTAMWCVRTYVRGSLCRPLISDPNHIKRPTYTCKSGGLKMREWKLRHGNAGGGKWRSTKCVSGTFKVK